MLKYYRASTAQYTRYDAYMSMWSITDVSILSVIILLRVYSKYQRMSYLLYSSDQAFRRRMSETQIADPVRLIPAHACLNKSIRGEMAIKHSSVDITSIYMRGDDHGTQARV